ncbi:MAG: ABC transporter permease [Chloroflexota bacterium]
MGGLRWPWVSAVLRRELRELIQNRWLLFGIAIPPVVLVVAPIVLGAILPPTALPPNLREAVIQQRPEWATLSRRELSGAFVVQQFLPYFLLMPAYVPLAIATFSIIGEKQSRSLEAVLATPIRTGELLAAKSVAALVPGVLVGWLTYLVFALLASLVYGPRLLGIVTDSSWLAGVFALGPAIGLASTVMGVIVSARVNDPRVAQQVGAVVIIPIVALAILQATGTLLVGAAGYLLLAAVVTVIAVIGLRIGVYLFQREAILTRWR